MKKKCAILWVRNDLRVSDNLALIECAKFEQLVPVFIWDNEENIKWTPGSASKWWLHHSLIKFKNTLVKLGSNLIVVKGKREKLIPNIANDFKASAVIYNRSYNPHEAKLLLSINKQLSKQDIETIVFSGNILCNKEYLLKKDQTPYLVYTPFWKNFVNKYKQKKPLTIKSLPSFTIKNNKYSTNVDSLDLLDKINWHSGFKKVWEVGENNALKKSKKFIDTHILTYNKDRDLPSIEGTSMLSPHFCFGEIHPSRILYLIHKKYGDLDKIENQNIIQYCKEIVWREFSYHLLLHFPHTADCPLKEKFKDFPWKFNSKLYSAWKKGKTGYPIVDAGMRQLWATGWMHNRVRMIVASFLIKHLRIPWIHGAKWFWDTLVDADIASNTQGWQWVAGCGADAAPYFRIFNPTAQGERFDPEGKYVKKWCPELSKLEKKWIHKPWEAPLTELSKYSIVLGEDYPKPIVDHNSARLKALFDYENFNKSKK